MKTFRFTAFCAALAFALIAAGSCGKKAPPKAPVKENLPVAEKLESEVRGSSLILKWSLTESPEEKKPDPAGFVVYRAKTPLSKDCPECPGDFERAGWVAYRSGRIVPDTWYFEDRVEPGYVYMYRIRCYSDSGRVGRESETVKYSIPGSSDDR